MKKTKLLTSLAALALVLGLGACEEPVEEETSEDDDVTTETSDTTETEGGDGDTGEGGDSGAGSGGEGGDTGAGSGGGEGGNEDDPVANLLADIKQNNNFTLTIEYYDWYSDYYEVEAEMLADYYGGTMSVYGHDYYVDITATEDALLLEYYYSYQEWYFGVTCDIELYVNTDDGLQIYYISQAYDTDLYLYDTEEDTTWQEYFSTPINLADYSSRFVQGETTTGSYGEQIDYTIDSLDLSFLMTLCNCLFTSGNYFADYYSYFIYYYFTYYLYYGSLPSVSSTYYIEDSEWDLSAYYFWEWSYSDSTSSTGKLYWLEFDSVYTALYDVGTSSIPSTYSQYLS